MNDIVREKFRFYLEEVKAFAKDFYVFYRYEVPEAFVKGFRRWFK